MDYRYLTFLFNTIPNHPNYFLGPVLGSVCDSLPHVGVAEHSNQILFKAYPNPSNGKFTLQFPAQSVQGVCEVYDVNGKCVFKESVAQWSQYKRVDVSDKSSGIYFCKMFWSDTFFGNVKVLKQ